ncbi:hypothetical protein PVAP13_7KG020300 [Panicum virgatum]|uniref:Uncharacterized protein n=1 Tax=Panicum virgatum TaxID=38727 RepID=A0A8T0QIR1_PANVG|nr:hypothetical protein PVAP13_7KG020300 [Panicum virgatum]
MLCSAGGGGPNSMKNMEGEEEEEDGTDSDYVSRGGEAAMVGSAVSNNKLFLFSVSRAEDGLDGFNRFEAS